LTDKKLKAVTFNRKEIVEAFNAISQAIDQGEANYGEEGSNRVEEDWRIIQKVFGARALIEDIHEQLRPWANAFGFSPRDPEEVKLSWSLTVGKAVGICQALMRELSPGWQSRGRIGTNSPNTIEALLESIEQINAADLDKALRPEEPEEAEPAPGTQPQAPQGKPTPKGLDTDLPKAEKRPGNQPLRRPEQLKSK
jgi:hypothetical protein